MKKQRNNETKKRSSEKTSQSKNCGGCGKNSAKNASENTHSYDE